MISKLGEHDQLVNVVLVLTAVGALLLHNLYIGAGWVVAFSLFWLWSVLSRDDEQLRRGVAGYTGSLGKPLAWVISKIPGAGLKVLCSLLALGLCGFGVGVVLSDGSSARSGRAARDSQRRAEPAAPLARPALVARANSICADADAKSHLILAAGSNPARHHATALIAAFDQETKDLRALAAAADVAGDWHAVVAGLVADNRRLGTLLTAGAGNLSVGRTRLSHAARKGHAAERKLGIYC